MMNGIVCWGLLSCESNWILVPCSCARKRILSSNSTVKLWAPYLGIHSIPWINYVNMCFWRHFRLTLTPQSYDSAFQWLISANTATKTRSRIKHVSLGVGVALLSCTIIILFAACQRLSRGPWTLTFCLTVAVGTCVIENTTGMIQIFETCALKTPKWH